MMAARRAAATVLALAAAAGCSPEAPTIDPAKLARARMMEDVMAGRVSGGPFTLTDEQGARRSLREFRGKVVLLYFGYTFCPDVCPTDLVELARLLQQLGPRAREVQAIFITVDPERDRPAQLGGYVRAFHPDIVALSGSIEEIAEVAQRYSAYYAKTPAGATYLMEHSANFYLLDREGRFAGTLPPGTSAERLADVLLERLAP